MKRALALAEKGRHEVSPNPMVGALIVRDGKVIAEGYHARYGDIHAEEAALRDCLERDGVLKGRICMSHWSPAASAQRINTTVPVPKRSGTPASPASLSHPVDPNPRVAGRGIHFLRKQGIEVVSGILAEKEERLNEIYRRIQAEERPFVELKAALTADGFLAARDGSSRWISCDALPEKGHGHALLQRCDPGRRGNPQGRPALTHSPGRYRETPGRKAAPAGDPLPPE